MSNSWQSLIDRIRGELADLDLVAARAIQNWSLSQPGQAEHDVYIDSVALNLHGFYTGLERLFELIARQVDLHLPEGANWHRDLLTQMAQDMPDTRPSVIDAKTAAALDEFRRFRHLVRNVYTVHLDVHKMQPLLQVLPELWATIQAELLAMADYLELLGESL